MRLPPAVRQMLLVGRVGRLGFGPQQQVPAAPLLLLPLPRLWMWGTRSLSSRSVDLLSDDAASASSEHAGLGTVAGCTAPDIPPKINFLAASEKEMVAALNKWGHKKYRYDQIKRYIYERNVSIVHTD